MSENSPVPNPNSMFKIPSLEEEAIKDAIEVDIKDIYDKMATESQPQGLKSASVERSTNPTYIDSIREIGRVIEKAREEQLEVA
jgi:hypothetical protein